MVDASAPRDPNKPAPGATAGPDDKTTRGGIGQAVVETREPLSGKLTQDDIRRILEQNGEVFGDCYTLGAGGKLKNFKGSSRSRRRLAPKAPSTWRT